MSSIMINFNAKSSKLLKIKTLESNFNSFTQKSTFPHKKIIKMLNLNDSHEKIFY